MQIKWLEDFIALAATRSFSRAAELRHVTHPAFGRRIRALEQWAGVPLVERGGVPVVLTPAGERLLGHAQQSVTGFAQVRDALRGVAGLGDDLIRLGTGRTLAHTLATDLLRRAQEPLVKGRVLIRTGSMAETLQRLEHGEIDFMLTYHHPLLAVRLSARQYLQRTVAHDRLLPMTRINAQKQLRWTFDGSGPTPYLAYSNTLALGRLVDDHLAHLDDAPWLRPCIEADSADALRAYVIEGMGVAWLPWSMMVNAHKAGQVAVLGRKSLEIGFEVRIVRPKRRMSALAETFWRLTDND